MEIRNFLTFKAIVEHGSFTKAAQALNYAQSSITSHVQAIEEYYGQPVFDRMGKRITLNSFGMLVYQQSLPLLSSYEDVCNLKHESGEPSGTLRIGAPESTMIYRLSPVLRQYKEKYPHVEIVMHNATCPAMRELIRKGDLDMAILLDRMVEEPDLIFEPLFAEPMSIVLPREYPSEEIVDSPDHAVLYTEHGCSYRMLFQEILEHKGINAENIIETASVEVIKQYVLCNLGISFLPTIVVKKEIENGEIRHIKQDSLDPITIQLAYHKRKWLSPAMEAFMEFTRTEAAAW